MYTIHQPHDALLRRIFSSISMARKLVKAFLMQYAPEFAAKVSWETFLIEKNGFIDAQLQKRYGDLVGSVMVEGRKVVFILEFESCLEQIMPKRVVEYGTCAIVELRDPKTGILPICIPIVFHVGTRAYAYPKQFMDVYTMPNMVQNSLLQLPWVVSIGKQSMQETLQYEEGALPLLIVHQSHKGSPLEFLEQTAKAAQMFSESPFIDDLAHYIGHMETQYSKKGEEAEDYAKVCKRITKLAANKTDTIMSGLARIEANILKQGLEKGLKRGIEKGLEKGLKRGAQARNLAIAEAMFIKSYPIDAVRDITGLGKYDLVRLQRKAIA
jgi:hypothetical protein